MDLLKTIYQNDPDLLDQIRGFTQEGDELNQITAYGESPLRVASNNGRFDVVQFLIKHGADKSQLGWSPTFFALAFGNLASLEKSIRKNQDLDHRDYWGRTPFLLALQVGDLKKVQLLLQLGADQKARGKGGKTAFSFVIQNGHIHLLRWLLEQGFYVNQLDDFGVTPLMQACEYDEADAVRVLLEAGADMFQRPYDGAGCKAIQLARSMAVVNLLVENGEQFKDLSQDARQSLLRIGSEGDIICTLEEYEAHRDRRFGNYNPEVTSFPFWLAMIKNSGSAYQAKVQFKDRRHHGWPVWCYMRFGRTTNLLPDGRVIEIGGEHEDFYDPDFCIYNDVVVFRDGEEPVIYSYPKSVFPPTDFHTATFVDDSLYIIGKLGYKDDRREWLTPVYRLDLSTYAITIVATKGTNPGWIHRHQSHYDGKGTIVLTEGEVLQDGQFVDNEKTYYLDVAKGHWRTNE